MKICSKCKIEKQKEDFHKDKKNKDGLYSKCKNCIKEDNKEYRSKNKEKINQQRKEYREVNKKKLKQQNKEYCENNRIKISEQKKEYYKKNREQRKEYEKKRRRDDPNFRTAHRLRNRATRGIVSQGGVKSASSQELLGCTWWEGRIYIENQFLPGMSWENHGEWEIDHIRPMASFDLTDPQQQRECCHYTNLRPMWWEENRSKSSIWNGIKHYHA